MRGVFQGIFLILVMTAIALTAYHIGSTSGSVTEIVGRATIWGLLIAVLTAFGWEQL